MINFAPNLDPVVYERYLKMLAQASGQLSQNRGAQRKDIWKYFMDNFSQNSIDYKTFLIAISQLEKSGKIEKNENGYFWIQKAVYSELHRHSKQGKLSASSLGHSQHKKSAGRLSAINLAKRSCMGVGKSFGASISVHNGKYGGFDDIPAKKRQERFSQSQKPDSNGKKGSKGSQQKFAQTFNIPTPTEPSVRKNGGDSNEDEFSDSRRAVTRSKQKLPDINQDPLEEIKKKLLEETRPQPKKEKKASAQQSQSIDYQNNNPGHKSCKNPNSKLGKKADQAEAEAVKQKPKTQAAQEQEFGFKSNSQSMSQISKDENQEPVLGMFTPRQASTQIKGPEDLYPDQIKKADELSLGDIAQTPHVDDDLNFNEKDYEIHDAIHYGDLTEKSNNSYVKKKKSRNIDSYSQISNISQHSYMLRPRNSNRKQSKPLQQQSGKKTQDKQARKRPQIEDFDDAASNLSQVSGVSQVSIGFGAYQTRNYSHYKEATQNQIVTRNKYSEILSNRPQVSGLCNTFMRKLDPKMIQVTGGQSAISGKSANGKKRSFDQATGGSYQPQKTPEKIQKTSHSSFSRMLRSDRFSAMTGSKKEMINMQKLKAKVHHENALRGVMSKSRMQQAAPKYAEPQRPTTFMPVGNRKVPNNSQMSTRSKAANFKVPQTVLEIKQLYDQKKRMANSQSTSISGELGSANKKKHHFQPTMHTQTNRKNPYQ